jgi:hypothetical protein
MTKLCADCNQVITGRENSAKFCWACCDLRPRKNGQAQAASKVNQAVKKGLLPHVSTLICVDCGKPAQCYEHRDYNKPLEVVPTCKGCNIRRGPAIPLNQETNDTRSNN